MQKKISKKSLAKNNKLKIAPQLEQDIISKIITTPKISNDINKLNGVLAYKTIDHEIIHASDKFLKYLGCKKSNEILGKTDYDLIWQKYSNIYHGHENDALSGKCYNAIHPATDVDGRYFLVFNQKYPWINPDGKIIGIVSYSIEIQDSLSLKLGSLLKNLSFYNKDDVYYIGKNNSTYNFSQKEIEFLFYLVRGKTMSSIAKIWNVPYREIIKYVENLKEKFNCPRKSDLIEFAIKEGLAYALPDHLSFGELIHSLSE
jgi:DNA-binding CsgD family transcriptional regulator